MDSCFRHERRWCERASVYGSAAILEIGYLGIVYALEDISLGGARLRGPRPLPDASFVVLIYVSDRFYERRARAVWSASNSSDSLGIEFDKVYLGSSLVETFDEEDEVWREAMQVSQLSRSAAQ